MNINSWFQRLPFKRNLRHSVEGVTVRCWTPVGKSEQGQFALDTAVGSLSFFGEYFDSPYPLPKMDMGIFERLDKRVVHEPDSYLEMIDAYSTGTYGRFGFKPKDWGGKQAGVYYLTEVDEWGVRTYEQQS